jgi:hypothetical protein
MFDGFRCTQPILRLLGRGHEGVMPATSAGMTKARVPALPLVRRNPN